MTKAEIRAMWVFLACVGLLWYYLTATLAPDFESNLSACMNTGKSSAECIEKLNGDWD